MSEICNFEIDKSKTIHFIGIGGISMSGIAIMLKKSGFNVTGSDISLSEMVKIVINENIPVTIGSDIDIVKKADVVVYTAAISKDNEEYVAAMEANIPTFERAPFLGMLLKHYDKPICIAGMHGKTTTTSMVASVLKRANVNPTVLVGAKLKELDNLNYLIGDKKFFVLEACEYVDSFLNFPGDTSVILNIEEEHLDYFKNIENIKNSFKRFMLNTHDNGNLVINIDDALTTECANDVKDQIINKNINIYTYSISNSNASIYAENIRLMPHGCYSFDVLSCSNHLCHIVLNAPGYHNVSNALATICSCIANDIPIGKIKEGIEEFTGASRRFEFKKTIDNNVNVYDDYAHHPTEIKTTLKTAKEMCSGKVWAVFQPHTYSRLKTLFSEFEEAFFDADELIVTDIYAAREPFDPEITPDMLVNSLNNRGITSKHISKFEDIATYLKDNIKTNDLIVTIGAGTITTLSDLL